MRAPPELATGVHARRIHAATAAARSAGAALMRLRGTDVDAREAAAGQLKTIADEASEGWVLGYLRACFPGDAVLSEERYEADPAAWRAVPAYWAVDALDGTRSFAEGFPGFCVQLAWIEEGAPVVGVVYEPVADRLYVAAAGQGAFRQDGEGPFERLRVADTRRAPILVDSTRPGGAIGAWLQRRDAGFLECGSIGLKLCRVAEGSADVFLKVLRFKIWDVAPGELILSEAGGELVLWDGKPVSYDGETVVYQNLLACARGRAAGILAELREAGDG